MTVGWRFDGKVLASGGGDNKIILWDPNKGERLKTLEGHRLAKLFFFYLPRSPGERRRRELQMCSLTLQENGRGVDDHYIM